MIDKTLETAETVLHELVEAEDDWASINRRPSEPKTAVLRRASDRRLKLAWENARDWCRHHR